MGMTGPMSDPAAPSTFFAADAAAWRAWLEGHHATEREVWLVLLKRHVPRRSIRLDEAVEEALCFGWIDGMLRRIDDESHMLRFTPRRPGSVWAASNKARVERLIAEGRMRSEGLALVEEAKRRGEWDRVDEREEASVAPDDLAEALTRNAAAHESWERLAPSHKKMYLSWIAEAKRPETRARRIAETVRRAREGRRPGA